MRQRQHFHRSFGKNFSHLPFEVCFFSKAPEIIGMNEAAAQKIRAQDCRFFISQIQAARLDDVGIWVVEDLFRDPDHIGIGKYAKVR